jgi:type II secretory pathway component GspD/PulD (secretin)
MRLSRLLALAVLLGAGPAMALPEPKPPAPPPPAQGKRFVYLVRYGAAKDLAESLSRHFKGESGLQIVPEPNANALLVTAPPALADELVKLFDQLDRRPRQVVVEVAVAEVPLDEKEDGIDPSEFTGPADEVLKKVEALARKTKHGHLRRFRLTALENQRSSVHVGESKPTVTGVNVGGFGRGGAGGGPVSHQVAYREVGSMFSATPRVAADGTVTVELVLNESRLHTPDNGVQLGGGAIASETVQTTLTGKVSVPPGKAVLAEGVKTESKGAKVQAVVVVSARVVEK